MDWLWPVAAIISAVTTCFVSCFHAWLDYKKSKESDAVWETVTRLACKDGFTNGDLDRFVQFYTALSHFRQNPDSQPSTALINQALNNASAQSSQPKSV